MITERFDNFISLWRVSDLSFWNGIDYGLGHFYRAIRPELENKGVVVVGFTT